MTETIETIVLKPEPKQVKQKKPFAGFKADLAVDIPELALRVPVRYWKLDAEAIKSKLNIVHRVGSVDVSNKPSPYRDAGLKVRAWSRGRPVSLKICRILWPSGAGSMIAAKNTLKHRFLTSRSCLMGRNRKAVF